MDITTITAALNGLKISKEIFVKYIETKAADEARPKILEALDQLGKTMDTLFSLREELSKLQTENDKLRKELTDTQSWKEKSNQYKLVTTDGGAIVYEFNSDPKHFICPSCYDKKQFQILQDNRTSSGTFRCIGCSAEFPVNSNKPQSFTRTVQRC